MTGAAETFVSRIEDRFGATTTYVGLSHGIHVFKVSPDIITDLCQFLNDELEFNFLSDICGVDYLPETPRFEVVYHLYSLSRKWRIRLKCRLDDPPQIKTVTGIWRTADWHEREAWDMYGIVFEGHPDLRRIYMWEGFEGFPQRKDFPLRGYRDELNPFGAEGPAPTRPDLETKDIP